jgi:hypothetical protein
MAAWNPPQHYTATGQERSHHGKPKREPYDLFSKSIADAKRNKMVDVYRPLREAAKERQAQAPDAPRGTKKEPSVTQLVVEQKTRSEKETDAIRARAAGTNRTYINLADSSYSGSCIT